MSKFLNVKAYGSDSVSNAEAAKRRRNELWQALNRFVIENGGAVVSLPLTSRLRIEVPPDSALPTKLTEFGYSVCQSGRCTRIGADAKNPFAAVDIIEIDLPAVR